MASCLPPEPPAWVVDYPIAWGIEVRVVEPGYLGDDLVVPPGRTRADVYPGDTIEWRWHGAGPEGSVTRPPIWIATARGEISYDFAALSQGKIPACPDPLPTSPALCRLGVGDRMRVRLANAVTLANFDEERDYIEIFTVASDGDIIEPETCLLRALSERAPELSGCLFTARTAQIGPRWHLLSIFGFPEQLVEIADALVQEEPNFNPTFAALELTRTAEDSTITRTVEDGDEIAVRTGEPIALTVHLDDAQEYFNPSRTPEGEVVPNPFDEELTVWARFSASVNEYTGSEDGREHRWRADGPATLYLQADDGRGGRAFATLRFVTDEAR